HFPARKSVCVSFSCTICLSKPPTNDKLSPASFVSRRENCPPTSSRQPASCGDCSRHSHHPRLAHSLSMISAATVPPLLAIVGPTASGKSALGIFLAKKFGGEVVAC